MSPNLSSKINESLLVEKVRDTVNSLKIVKTTRWDGLPNEFFQNYQDFLISSLTLAFNEEKKVGSLLGIEPEDLNLEES